MPAAAARALTLQGGWRRRRRATVSVEGSRTWVARMRELGMQHVYIEVPGGDHSLFVRENPETLSRVFSFFNIVGKRQRSAGR
mgnify:CR=1 FL=1